MHHTPQPRGLTGPRPSFKLCMGRADTSASRAHPRPSNARPSAAPTPATCNPRSEDVTEAVQTIIDYLKTRNFPYTIALEDFIHLQPTQTRDICRFLLARLDPAAVLESLEEDLPNLLRILKYPATLTKSQLRNGMQRPSESLISALCWLVKLLTFIETCLPELSDAEYLPALLNLYGDCVENRSSGRLHDRQCVLALSKFVEENETEISAAVAQLEETIVVEQSDLDQLVLLLLRCRRLFDDESEVEEFSQKVITCYQYLLRVMKAQLLKRQSQFLEDRTEVEKDIGRMHSHLSDLDKLQTARKLYEADTAGIQQQIENFRAQAADCQRKLIEAQRTLRETSAKAEEIERLTNKGREEAEAREDKAEEVERLQRGIRELQDDIKSLEKDKASSTLEFTRLVSELHKKVASISREWQRCFEHLCGITDTNILDIDAVAQEIRITLGIDKSNVGAAGKKQWFEMDSLLKRYESENGLAPELALRAVTRLMLELNTAIENETTGKLARLNRELESKERSLSETWRADLRSAEAGVREAETALKRLGLEVADLEKSEQSMSESLQNDEAEFNLQLQKKEQELKTMHQNKATRRQKMEIKHRQDDRELTEMCTEIEEAQLELLEKIRAWEEEMEPRIDQVTTEEISNYARKLPPQFQPFLSGWTEESMAASESEAEETENVQTCSLTNTEQTKSRITTDQTMAEFAELAFRKNQPTPNVRRRQRRAT